MEEIAAQSQRTAWGSRIQLDATGDAITERVGRCQWLSGFLDVS